MKVLTAYNRAVRASNHLGDEHVAAVEAGRVLARKLDANLPGDNVSASVFLKYLEALQLVPEGRERAPAGSKLEALQAAVTSLHRRAG